MVSCNRLSNDKMIFQRGSLNILATPGVVFTDGNARSYNTHFFLYGGIDSLGVLSVKSIQTAKYAGDEKVKRQKQSEILIPDFLEFSQVLDIFVYSEEARKTVVAELLRRDIRVSVTKAWNWYYPKAGKA